MSRFDELREDIERLSVEILLLLNVRAGHALEMAREKHRLGLPMRDPWREAQLLDRLAAKNGGPLDDAAVRKVFRAILDSSVELMERRGASRPHADRRRESAAASRFEEKIA